MDPGDGAEGSFESCNHNGDSGRLGPKPGQTVQPVIGCGTTKIGVIDVWK